MPALSVPRTAKLDSTATEVLRVWLGAEDVHCTLQLDLGQGDSEPSDWGILLARIIRRVAHSIQEQKNVDAYGVEVDILEALLNESESPSTEPEEE
jgi:hypothetical protein